MFRFFTALSTVALLLTGATHSAAPARPNVLLIIADDLTASTLGCYGSAQAKTPHIDQLAAEGLRFDHAYCQFPVCGPSRAALMSGLYPQQNGVVSNKTSEKLNGVLGSRPSLAQFFRQSGYYSARVSKIYHMKVPGDITSGAHGTDHPASWDERFNCQAPEWMSQGKAEHLSNETLNFDPKKHYRLGFGSAFYVVEGKGDGLEQADHKAATKAAEILAAQASAKKPFFLAVGLVRPHVPLVAPKKYFTPFPTESMMLYQNPDNDTKDIPKAGRKKYSSQDFGLAGEQKKQKNVLRAYHATVHFMDAQVGRILAALEKNGLASNTIVVFKSDHGYHLGEHDLWQKMSLHEESVRIPLIIRAPGHQPGTTAALAEAIDLYPTLAELAGLTPPAHCVGKSLLPIFTDNDAAIRDEIYCFRGNADLLRTEKWAYLRYHKKGGEELYDMVADPKQFTNLAKKKSAAATLRMMRQRLKKKHASF